MAVIRRWSWSYTYFMWLILFIYLFIYFCLFCFFATRRFMLSLTLLLGEERAGIYASRAFVSGLFSIVITSLGEERAGLYAFIWVRSCENVSYAKCEQQRCRSACASAQSDQHQCCSLLDSMICILALANVSRLLLVSIAEQAGLNLIWSKVPENTFSRDVAYMLYASRACVCVSCMRYFLSSSSSAWYRVGCGLWLWHSQEFSLNPHLPNGLSHPYQLDDSIFHLRGVCCTFFIFYHIFYRNSCEQEV